MKKEKKEVRRLLRQEFGHEPSEAEIDAYMKGFEVGYEVVDLLAEITPEELLAAIKGGIN